jgi:hypothetical protein
LIDVPFSEQQFAARVVAALDESELPANISERLMLARARALEAATGALPARRNTLVLSRKSLVGLVGTLLLVLAAGVWYSNNMSASGRDYIDIDAAVLSGDLPVQAYLDRGFEAYVRQGLSTEWEPSR